MWRISLNTAFFMPIVRSPGLPSVDCSDLLAHCQGRTLLIVGGSCWPLCSSFNRLITLWFLSAASPYPFWPVFLLKTISTIVLTHNLLSTSITIEDHRREWMTLPSPPSVFDWSPDSPLSNTERIKMSTRGGWIVKPENSQTFSQLLNQVRSFWIFFWILQEIRRIRENVRIVRPVRGKQIQQKLNLLKWKSVKIGYVLGWDKPVYPLKSCRNLNTKYIDTKP
jgi:hypothetical protein